MQRTDRPIGLVSYARAATLADPDTADGPTREVTMIPASGEFTHATQAIRNTDGGATVPENLNALADSTDIVEALDRLQAMAPAVTSVSLVVAWFRDDLRVGSCNVRPGVEVSAKSNTTGQLVRRWCQPGQRLPRRPRRSGSAGLWRHARRLRGGASDPRDEGARPAGDLLPVHPMDVPPGNTLPNPYSDDAAGTSQPVFPWRGRITCSPAAGYAGTVDKTATAARQVAALFGAATPASFSVSGQSVSWTGRSGD